jgi:hypothetical protein
VSFAEVETSAPPVIRGVEVPTPGFGNDNNSIRRPATRPLTPLPQGAGCGAHHVSGSDLSTSETPALGLGELPSAAPPYPISVPPAVAASKAPASDMLSEYAPMMQVPATNPPKLQAPSVTNTYPIANPSTPVLCSTNIAVSPAPNLPTIIPTGMSSFHDPSGWSHSCDVPQPGYGVTLPVQYTAFPQGQYHVPQPEYSTALPPVQYTHSLRVTTLVKSSSKCLELNKGSMPCRTPTNSAMGKIPNTARCIMVNTAADPFLNPSINPLCLTPIKGRYNAAHEFMGGPTS